MIVEKRVNAFGQHKPHDSVHDRNIIVITHPVYKSITSSLCRQQICYAHEHSAVSVSLKAVTVCPAWLQLTQSIWHSVPDLEPQLPLAARLQKSAAVQRIREPRLPIGTVASRALGCRSLYPFDLQHKTKWSGMSMQAINNASSDLILTFATFAVYSNDVTGVIF